MKASSFSWISRTFSVKKNANVSKPHTNDAVISMAQNYHTLNWMIITCLLKFKLLLGKTLTWPHHCRDALSSGLVCIKIFVGFLADKVSSRVKCHCGYILCHPNSRWWPLTVQHSKGVCGWGADDEEVVFYCTSSPPHATSKPVPFRESWRRSGNRWQLLTMWNRGAKVMKMLQDDVL